MAPPPLGAPDASAEFEEEEDPEELEPWLPSDSEPGHPALEPWTPSPGPEPEQQPPPPAQTAAAAAVREERGAGEAAVAAVSKEGGAGEAARPRWPGWPGASVFRLVVPADKVGGLIGRRGEKIKRLCEETRARVRVLDAAHGAASRIHWDKVLLVLVLVSATEDVEAELSPAMNAAIKIFKHINEIEGINSDGASTVSAPEMCSVRLLVPSAQALHLIGKQGTTIKSIQENTGATIRIIHKDFMFPTASILLDEQLNYETVDERIVEIHGASLKVYNALKSVLGLLRRFLVDHGVLHLFERKNQAEAQAQDTSQENQIIDDHPLPLNQNFLLSDQQNHGSPKGGTVMYGCSPSFCDQYSSDIRDPYSSQIRDSYSSHFRDPYSSDIRGPYSSDIRNPTNSFITQITQTMRIPLPCAEEIIGVRGEKIEFIRSVSGAVVVLEEIRDYPNEVLVMIKGNPSQVQTAHELVQEVLSGYRAATPRSSYRRSDAGPRLLHSPHAIATTRDYIPSYNKDQQFHDRIRYSTHRGYKGYWL
ncbi:hypothetical protein ACP4OV_009607 [Aristida adscensionis]